MNVRGYLTILLLILSLSSCSSFKPIPVEPVVEVQFKEVLPPKPILPDADRISLRDIEWVIITPENVDEIFAGLGSNESKVFFAISADGYEKIALNLGDVRALIEQQKAIIEAYEDIWK